MFQTLTLPPSTFSPLQFQSPPPTSRRRSSYLRCTAAVQDHPEAAQAAAILYDVLRVPRDASSTEIKAAYRNLSKLYHPDASSDGSDGRDFLQIHNAYETLSDPAARAVYDMSLGLGGRVGRLTAASFGCDYVAVRRRPVFYPTSRRWETDQCW